MGCAASRDGSTTFVTARDCDTSSPSLSAEHSSTAAPPPPPPFALLPHKQPASSKLSSQSHYSSTTPPPPVVVVQHLPLRPGDSHHLVSLTSTTYGSLFLLDQPARSDARAAEAVGKDKQQLEEEDEKERRIQSTPAAVINAWELMDGLDEATPPTPASPQRTRWNQYQSQGIQGAVPDVDVDLRHVDFQPRSASFDYRQRHGAAAPVKSSPKPLWKHLSEESLLEDMDPAVASTLRRSFSYTYIYTPSSSTSTQTFLPTPKPVSSCTNTPGSSSTTKVILYTTSLRGVRRTYEDCCAVRSILRAHRAAVDERDVSMDGGYRRELQALVASTATMARGDAGRQGQLPQVFVGGKYIGGAEEVRRLEEAGQLAQVIREAVRVGKGADEVCDVCGGARFLPCSGCRGSRKVFDEVAGQVGRCPRCNENGLVRCPCCSCT